MAGPGSTGPVSGAPQPVSGAPGSGGPTNYQLGPSGYSAGPDGYPAGSPGDPSGYPPSAAGDPLGAAGTRVLSGGPHGAAPPVSGAGQPGGPGQFARGAAGVPPAPPPASDTGYTYAGTGPVPPAGSAPPGRPVRPGSAPLGGIFSGPAAKRNGLLIGGIAAGAVALLVVVVGAIFVFNNMGNNGGSPNQPGASPAAANQVKIDCEGMRNNTYTSVQKALEKQGFKVRAVPVNGGAAPGDVVDVPCSAPSGGTVDVKVASGAGGQSGNPNPNCSGFIGNILPGKNSCPPATAR